MDPSRAPVRPASAESRERVEHLRTIKEALQAGTLDLEIQAEDVTRSLLEALFPDLYLRSMTTRSAWSCSLDGPIPA